MNNNKWPHQRTSSCASSQMRRRVHTLKNISVQLAKLAGGLNNHLIYHQFMFPHVCVCVQIKRVRMMAHIKTTPAA